MHTRLFSIILMASICGILCFSITPASADTIQQEDLEIVRELITIDRVKQIAAEQFADKVEIIEVEKEVENGLEIYEVELIDQAGVKHEVKIDAKSGKVLKIEKED